MTDIELLHELESNHSNVVTVTPLLGTKGVLSHYQHAVQLVGYQSGSVMAAIKPMSRLDAQRDRVLNGIEGMAGDIAIVVVFHAIQDGATNISHYLAFTDVNDAIMFKLTWLR